MNSAETVGRFVLCVLALWRVTHLLAEEDGPWDLIVRLRRLLGETFLGRLMDCFYCLSLWLSLPVAIGLSNNWIALLLQWQALSGAACLLEKITSGPQHEIPLLPRFEGDIACAVVNNDVKSNPAELQGRVR